MNDVIKLFDYKIRNASNQFDLCYVVAFFFDEDFNKIYAIQTFDQEIEDENGSYTDSGYLVYSFTKNEKGLYLLKVDASFEDNAGVREYAKSNYSELSCYDLCNDKAIEKWVK